MTAWQAKEYYHKTPYLVPDTLVLTQILLFDVQVAFWAQSLWGFHHLICSYQMLFNTSKRQLKSPLSHTLCSFLCKTLRKQWMGERDWTLCWVVLQSFWTEWTNMLSRETKKAIQWNIDLVVDSLKSYSALFLKKLAFWIQTDQFVIDFCKWRLPI